jgi:hypothetical protein
MFDTQHFTHDNATVRFDGDADGITVDDGDADFDWSEVEQATVDSPPHQAQFESDQFYQLPATVAKPIPQPYQYGEDSVWLKKPREELKKAAWSLDNSPWTLDHPDTGMVKNVDDVRGFWADATYVDGADDLEATLHVPVNDDEAKQFVEDNSDVSVGFYNRIARTDDYDGVVGGADDTDIDIEGYQTDLIFDHVASVAVGRCPSGAGCGLDDAHGHLDAATTSVMSEEGQTADSMEVGSWVEWDASGGTAYGKIDEIVREGCTTRGKGDMEVCAEDDDPAAVVEVYDDESGESKEEMVRHKMRELRSWSNPSTDAMDIAVEDRLSEGALVRWDALDGLTGYIVHAPEGEPYYMVNILREEDGAWVDTKRTLTVGVSDVWGVERDDEQVMASDVVPDLSMEEGFKSPTGTTNLSDEKPMRFQTDAPSGIHVADGTWFAVGPDEHPDESTEWPDDAKFPVDSCQDVNDAWNLRGTGDISIEQSTLAERIKRVAEAKGCDLPESAEMDSTEVQVDDGAVATSAKRYSVCGSRKDVMRDGLTDLSGDCGCETNSNNETNNTMNFEFDDLSTEAALAKIESEHDGVSERLDDLREAQDAAEAARDAAEELDLDSVDDLADKVALIDERTDELNERIEELQRPKMEEDAAFIAENTDRFGDDAEEVIDNLDADAEAIEEKRELVEELTDGYQETTANAGGGESPDESYDSSTGYAKTPW